jgi:hypothetical protein
VDKHYSNALLLLNHFISAISSQAKEKLAKLKTVKQAVQAEEIMNLKKQL